jgi:redox-sensitive bicupin YhaK (pirin superfamily)
MMTAPMCALSAVSSGERGGRWKAWPPIRITWTSRSHQATRSGSRSIPAYVFAGSGTFRDASHPRAVLTEQAAKPEAPPVYDAGNHSLVLFDRGDEIAVQAGDDGIRFLLVSGKPIEEPVAWYGPIVMNTQEQLRQAVGELQDGTFIKHR